MERPYGVPWAWASALTLLFVLTGGFGLLVPRIHGLDACGDYVFGRLLLSLPIGVTLALAGLLARRSRRPSGVLAKLAPVVFGASVITNVLLGHDPLGAWLDWRAPHIDYAAIAPQTETAGCFFIENHEWITYESDSGVYRAGHGA